MVPPCTFVVSMVWLTPLVVVLLCLSRWLCFLVVVFLGGCCFSVVLCYLSLSGFLCIRLHCSNLWSNAASSMHEKTTSWQKLRPLGSRISLGIWNDGVSAQTRQREMAWHGQDGHIKNCKKIDGNKYCFKRGQHSDVQSARVHVFYSNIGETWNTCRDSKRDLGGHGEVDHQRVSTF